MGHVERLTGMKHRVLASVVLLALIAGACGNDEVTVPADSLPSVDPEQPSVTDDVATTTPPVDDTIQGSWTLVGMTVDGEQVDMLDDWPVTLMIEGDQISGTAACNSYGGTVQTDGTGGGRFVTSDLFSTEMGCEQVAMEMEQRFLASLQAIDSYELADGLYLAEAGVDTSLEFQRNAPIPDADLTGTTWVLDTLISGDAASNMAGMGDVYVRFNDDGSLVGATGCGGIVGSWTTDGERLAFSALDADPIPALADCSNEERTLDDSVFAVLEALDLTASVDGPRLTISGQSVDGVVGLSFQVGKEPVEIEQDGMASAGLDRAGGVDGPVMYWQQTDRQESEAAEVRGSLVLEGDCLYITAEFGRFPVLWPFGTRWQPAPAAVILPDGTAIEIGEDFSGGGGYHSPETLQGFTGSDTVAELAARCAEGLAHAKRLVRGALTWGLVDGTREEQHGFHAVLKADSAMAAMKDFLANGEDITR